MESSDYIDRGFPINHVAFDTLKCMSDTSFAVIDSTLTVPMSFVRFEITKLDDINVLKASVKVNFPETYFAPARNIKFPRRHGPGGEYPYAIFLPPTNLEYATPDGGLPPLIVAMHGGPTWQEGLQSTCAINFGPPRVMLWRRSTTSALQAMSRSISTCLISVARSRQVCIYVVEALLIAIYLGNDLILIDIRKPSAERLSRPI